MAHDTQYFHKSKAYLQFVEELGESFLFLFVIDFVRGSIQDILLGRAVHDVSDRVSDFSKSSIPLDSFILRDESVAV